MRFQIVLSKTLNDLMSLRRTVALVLLGLSVPVALAIIAWRESPQVSEMSLEMQIHYVINNFSIALFMWVAGLFLAVTVATTAAGFIAKEDSEGTLLLMVSKPIDRFEIVLGKFLALVISSMALQALILLLSVAIFWIVLPLDPDTFRALVKLIPWMFLYSIIVTIAFGAIATAFSVLMKSRVKIMLVLMIIIMVVFFIGMVVRTTSPQAYEDYRLYYPDLGYHLGNSFGLFVDRVESGKVLPESQALLGTFAGTYRSVEQSFDPDIGAMPGSLEATGYVSPAVSLAIWLAISAAALWLAAIAIKRKEVH